MCWIGLTKTECTKRIAEDNIPTTKLVLVYSNGNINSRYTYFTYLVNKEYKLFTPLELKKQDFCNEKRLIINTGFHSYGSDVKIKCEFNEEPYIVYANYKGTWTLDYLDLKPKGLVYGGTLAIADCIIPKGSEYYLNLKGEYVSDTIKIINVYKIKAK